MEATHDDHPENMLSLHRWTMCVASAFDSGFRHGVKPYRSCIFDVLYLPSQSQALRWLTKTLRIGFLSGSPYIMHRNRPPVRGSEKTEWPSGKRLLLGIDGAMSGPLQSRLIASRVLMPVTIGGNDSIHDVAALEALPSIRTERGAEGIFQHYEHHETSASNAGHLAPLFHTGWCLLGPGQFEPDLSTPEGRTVGLVNV